MEITKEDLSITFQVPKGISRKVLDKFGLRKLNKTLVIGRVSDEKEIYNYIKSIEPYVLDEDNNGILLSRVYFINIPDEDIAYEFFNSLFLPQFKIKDYAISDINFYSDFNDITYAINMRYDFENKVTIMISRFTNKKDDFEKHVKNFEFILADILKEEMNDVCCEE